MSFEKCEDLIERTITSNNVLCCAETGRVVAVFYNESDLETIIKRLNKDEKIVCNSKPITITIR